VEHLEDCLEGKLSTLKASFDFDDGRGPRDLEYTFNPYRSAQGQVTHMVIVTKDVTDYLQAQRLLDSAREEAIKAGAQKGAFLANMSHEIRTPLNAVLGLTELTLRSPLSAEQRDNLETVLGSAHSLLDLINDILDISKIEAGRMSLEATDFDLPARVGLILKTFRLSAEAKGLSLELAMDEGSPRYVQGDPLRLGQLVTNLVGNAIKFTEAGGVKVRISPWKPEGGGGLGEAGILVAVADTGVGIPLDKQQLIFESFSQADPSVSRRYGGTGLGLTICRELAGLFGGRIWVESRPGEGSTFFFTARLARGDPARIQAAPSRRLPDASLAQRPLRILVVEDNPVNAKVAQRWLTQARHEVSWAASGAEAFEALSASVFDLMLLDIEMPDMNGFEVARRVRKGGQGGPSGPGLAIVAMTAHAGTEVRDACAAAGMDDYVAKPVDFVELAATLSRVVRPNTREYVQTPAGASGLGPQCSDDALICTAEPMRRLGGDLDLYQEILAIFAAEAPARIAAFEEAMSRGDREAMRRLAHSLRGSALAVGADRLAEAATRLEAASGPGASVEPAAGGSPAPAAPWGGELITLVVDLLGASAREASSLLPPGYVVPTEA
jgi:signal transduction histidine kinase/CheY-like chemotaxis protein